MKKILFCIPYYDEYDWVNVSLDRFKKYSTGSNEFILNDCRISIEARKGYDVKMCRNLFIAKNVGLNFEIDLYEPELRNYDEWIFCDSDIEFTEKHLLRVLKLDKDIVSLPYSLNSTTKNVYNVIKDREYFPFTTENLLEVDGNGAGGLFKIKRKVFEKVPPYWFEGEKTINENRLAYIPEDYTFCNKARKAGFKLWVDFNYPLKHHKN
jgi:hypothetical protein